MNLLFTGIGGPTPLGLARSVKQAFPDSRCIGVDGSPWATNLYNSEIFDNTYQIVQGSHLKYWDVITEVINDEKIDFAFVVPETEVLIWSERKNQADLPCKTVIPDYELASFCFDKLKVATFLHGKGLTPQTEEFKINEALKIDFPFWIRVKSGAGALGALKVKDQKDLDTWLTLHNFREDFIISEFLPGRNYACKLLYYNGELIQHASAERIDYLLAAAAPSGISGMCARGKLLNRGDLVERSNEALHDISKRTGVRLHGIFTVDFKEKSDGTPLITEVNIRHVSFNYAFTLGGINFAKTTLQKTLGLESDIQPPNTFKTENYFLRGVDAPIRLIPIRD